MDGYGCRSLDLEGSPARRRVEVGVVSITGVGPLEEDRLDWPTRPHHDSGFRFPILDFGFLKSVWRMENLEYRTMKPWTRGAHTWAGSGRIRGREPGE